MFQLTLAQLIACGIAPTPARAVLAPLQAQCATYAMNTPKRAAAFVAECMVESSGFTAFEENLYYTTPARVVAKFPSRVADVAAAAPLLRNPKALANVVYAGKNGNGPPATGDGWTYRGRGAIGLSGLANYSRAENALGRPYLSQPDLVAEPPDAVLTAAWYWSIAGLNRFADTWQIDLITRVINGPGMSDAERRRQCAEQALHVFYALATAPELEHR